MGGNCYSEFFDAMAIVRADNLSFRISVTVSGKRRREYFAILRKTIHDINSSFEKLKVSEFIPLPDTDGLELEYSELLAYEETGKDEYFVGKLRRSFPVKELLNGIETEYARIDKVFWDVFISYSHKDHELIKKLTAQLNNNGITYWMEPGNSVDNFANAIQKCRTIFLCISQNFFSFKSGTKRGQLRN